MIGGLIFLVLSFLRNRAQPAQNFQYQTQTSGNQNVTSPFRNILSNLDPASTKSRPEMQTVDGRDEEMLRQMKVIFMRLQAAYDAKDIADIRRYTTPEVLAEIQMQIQERGNDANQTEVMQLHAELLERWYDDLHELVSVRFSGTIKEDPQTGSHPFEEIWHFQAKSGNNAWFVAGIQQI